MHLKIMRRPVAMVSLLSLPVVLLSAAGATTAATASPTVARSSAVTTSSLGMFKPTFAGTAATGCATACSLLTGPLNTPSTAAAARANPATGQSGTQPRAHAMPLPHTRHIHITAAQRRLLTGSSFPVPSVSCVPLGPGCDRISTSKGGATSVKGLNAVDSAEHTTNIFKTLSPRTRACALATDPWSRPITSGRS